MLTLHFPGQRRGTANASAARTNQGKPAEQETVGVMEFRCICGADVLPDPARAPG